MHTIDQGEGGEQGDPLMPLLLALGQHGAPEAVQRTLRGDERLLAFLDDIYIITTPPRVGAGSGSSSSTHAFGCTGARHKSGMVLGSGLRRAMPLSRLPVLRTLEPWCGRDLICLSRIRASRCWEHHWATPSLSQHIWSGSRRNTECCWNESQQCKMYNVHG